MSSEDTADEPVAPEPPKRKPGRPKGALNKKTIANSISAAAHIRPRLLSFWL